MQKFTCILLSVLILGVIYWLIHIFFQNDELQNQNDFAFSSKNQKIKNFFKLDFSSLAQSIHYTEISERTGIILTNQKLIRQIEKKLSSQTLTIKQIIDCAKHYTQTKLSFSLNVYSNDPNVILQLGKANCIGYSSLFNAIVQLIIDKQGLQERYQTRHLVGKLTWMGMNLHQYFDDPAFKDHDYNEIIDLMTGEKYQVDPTLQDYLTIYLNDSK